MALKNGVLNHHFLWKKNTWRSSGPGWSSGFVEHGPAQAAEGQTSSEFVKSEVFFFFLQRFPSTFCHLLPKNVFQYCSLSTFSNIAVHQTILLLSNFKPDCILLEQLICVALSPNCTSEDFSFCRHLTAALGPFGSGCKGYEKALFVICID